MIVSFNYYPLTIKVTKEEAEDVEVQLQFKSLVQASEATDQRRRLKTHRFI